MFMKIFTSFNLKIFTLLIAAGMLAGCLCNSGKNRMPDVLLLTTDTDFPELDSQVTENSLRLSKVYTTSPSTLPAAASLVTGLIPPEHGLRVDGVGALLPGTTTIAGDLKGLDFNYRTGAFLASPALASAHGLTNEFVEYKTQLDFSSKDRKTATSLSAVVDAALKFASEGKKKKQPSFIWVHLPSFSHSGTNVIEHVKRLTAYFDDTTSIKVIVPLSGYVTNAPFRGMSLEDEHVSLSVIMDGLELSGTVDTPLSIIDLKSIILAAAAGESPKVEEPESIYSESIMPWYVFRLPPLQRQRGRVGTLPPAGLGKVEPQVLARQSEMLLLNRFGHVGEGLIPPYGEDTVEELSDFGSDLIEEARAALMADTSEKKAALGELIKKHPETPIFRSWLGDVLLSEKNYMEACNEYAKASEFGYNMIGAYRKQARCHAAIGNITAAIDKAESAFLLNPSDPVLRYELAQLLLGTGTALMVRKDMKTADECLSRAHWLEPRNADIMVQLAQLRLATAQTNSALTLLDGALKIRPGHPVAKSLKKGIKR